jgi:hypothetical protein
MEFVRSKHSFFRIGKDDYVAGRFKVPPYEVTSLTPVGNV